MITVKNLHAKAEDKQILNGINLEVKAGEVHAIMGEWKWKKYAFKSHCWHPAFEVTEGSVEYKYNGKNNDLLDWETHERSQRGIFLVCNTQ